ncbi:hypothetical protein [Maribacter sp. 2304DJ31-5]|uniref:hypothetical protein n=1 Tax=Maribacter sp. 2304DJ31-5 TaxID=3386273 RepID=UPI0039BCD0B3
MDRKTKREATQKTESFIKEVKRRTRPRFSTEEKNLAPADVYFGRDEQTTRRRERIKRKTMALGRNCYQRSKQLN